MELTVRIFGRRQYHRKVYKECRRLAKAGRLERRGKGGSSDPFTYYLPRAT
jgi:hypothetical protein